MPFGRMGGQYPHFLKLAPTLGSVKSSILHGAWRFHFFSKKIAKIRGHLDLDTVGILVSWKSEFSKNSSRIASVMEIFCTLLQCKVRLSMFHSSPTFKI
jgi:hypothetical protein